MGKPGFIKKPGFRGMENGDVYYYSRANRILTKKPGFFSHSGFFNMGKPGFSKKPGFRGMENGDDINITDTIGLWQVDSFEIIPFFGDQNIMEAENP
ncbi:MAG TPA: hypothetical protein DEP38_07275 [Cyanobacteria bacterium UBA9226]|nr:hypothetical protein [Cyanobacteria bacterium UBA9226]